MQTDWKFYKGHRFSMFHPSQHNFFASIKGSQWSWIVKKVWPWMVTVSRSNEHGQVCPKNLTFLFCDVFIDSRVLLPNTREHWYTCMTIFMDNLTFRNCTTTWSLPPRVYVFRWSKAEKSKLDVSLGKRQTDFLLTSSEMNHE